MSRASGGHPRPQMLGKDDRRAQVHVERAVDLLLAVVVEAPGGGQRGVGHQHVDLAGTLGEPPDVPPIGEVGLHDLASDLARQILEHLDPAPGEDELRAPLGQRARDRVAEATGRAGQQRALARELHPSAQAYAPKIATVAVKPCRKLAVPTGPISPAAKNPAAGASSSVRVQGPGVVVWLVEHRAAPPVAGEDQCARRVAAERPGAQRRDCRAGRGRPTARRARAGGRPDPRPRRRPPRSSRARGRRRAGREPGSRRARSRASARPVTIPTSSPWEIMSRSLLARARR